MSSGTRLGSLLINNYKREELASWAFTNDNSCLQVEDAHFLLHKSPGSEQKKGKKDDRKKKKRERGM